MVETRRDGFLGGRLLIHQPVAGYRAGADAVMLAAACPVRPGERVLELGCGAGVASLCVGARVPGTDLTGLERQPGYAALARQNAAENSIPLRVVEADLADMPAALRAEVFDHVIANPPFFTAGTTAPDGGRAQSRHEETPLTDWIAAGLRRLRPGGRIVVIQRADRLGQVLTALAGAGDVAVLPIAARQSREAGRIIVGARKGSRAPLRLLAPLLVHANAQHECDGEDLNQSTGMILRDGAEINLW